ncbi:kinase-like domain-containing protein [Crucibulum laeve]|uniref:Kinase-like domain-containing protein n=1 Tax=Crucibulum laeve TaxID=68775 RepID=A0A5C3LIP6_9AGAR|nr:kinase-like domain-containing protein [Crucibulum laeve]
MPRNWTMKVLNAEVKTVDQHPQFGGAHANIWRGQLYVTQNDPSIQLGIVTKAKAWSILSHPYILEILGIFTDITITGAPGTITYYRPLGNISTFLCDNRSVNKLALEGEEFIPQIAFCTFTRTILNEMPTTGTTLFTVHRHTPPELLCAENPTTADLSLETDIYAFGMLALEVVTGKPPFYNCMDIQAVLLIASGSKPLRYHYVPCAELGDPLWALLERCWSIIPLNRPTMDEVCRLLQDVI